MPDRSFQACPIGVVRSSLTSLRDAPKQGAEGAPDAWIALEPALVSGLDGLHAGQEIFVLTWLHRADREVLRVHPRGNPATPLAGVFSTRSPSRPNPIGLHPVTIRRIEGSHLEVGPLEALDGTPVLDLKPGLGRGMQETGPTRPS